MPRALRVLHQCQVTMRHPSLGLLASVADIPPLGLAPSASSTGLGLGGGAAGGSSTAQLLGGAQPLLRSQRGRRDSCVSLHQSLPRP